MTGDEVLLRARDEVFAAEAQVVVDGINGVTSEALARARAAAAAAENAIRQQVRSIALHA